MSKSQVVLGFFAAIKANDKQEILKFFNEDSIYNNIPIGAVKGPDEIWAVLGLLHEQAKSVEYLVHHIAETEAGWVLTERTDRYELADTVAEFLVMGSFEIKDGIIRQWRDYFDLKQSLDQLP